MKKELLGVFIWETEEGRVIQEVKLAGTEPPGLFFFTHENDLRDALDALKPKTITPKLPKPTKKQPEKNPKDLIDKLNKDMKDFWSNPENFK